MKNLVGNMAIRKYRINVTKVLIILYMCMPLADTLNGYILLQLKSEFSVGQLYRIVLIFFTGFVFLKRGFSKILFEPTLILAAIFVLLSCIHIGFGNPLKEEILLLSQWILLPILLSGLLELKRREEFGKRETGCIFEVYSWMVPATIIIPKMMGIGFEVYSGGLGYKGLYYANNGVSFLVSVLVIYAFGRLFEKRSVLGIVKVCLLVVTCLLLGTKACMAAVAVGLFFSIFLSFRKNVVRGCATTLVVLMLFVAVGFVYHGYVSDKVNDILTRLAHMGNVYAGSILDVVTSGRTLKAKELTELMRGFGGYPVSLLVGMGNVGIVAEMDFFDLYFQYGFLGAAGVVMYGAKLAKKLQFDMGCYKILLIFSFVYSFIAGHVFNNAMSSMVVVLILSSTRLKRTKHEGGSGGLPQGQWRKYEDIGSSGDLQWRGIRI